MTPEQLKAIRYRLRQATKSHKWFTDGSKVCVEWYKGNSPVLAETFVPAWHEDRQMGLLEAAHNAEFIANAPNDIDALLDEVERLRGALEWYADSDHYFRHPISKDSDAEWDNGEKARRALAGEPV